MKDERVYQMVLFRKKDVVCRVGWYSVGLFNTEIDEKIVTVAKFGFTITDIQKLNSTREILAVGSISGVHLCSFTSPKLLTPFRKLFPNHYISSLSCSISNTIFASFAEESRHLFGIFDYFFDITEQVSLAKGETMQVEKVIVIPELEGMLFFLDRISKRVVVCDYKEQ